MSLPSLLLLSAVSVRAAEVPPVYDRAVELVSTLYLEPDAVTPEAMLHAAGEHLSDRIDWLRVEPSPGALRLLYGAEEEIGFATVASWDDLPAALYAVETALVAAGHPLGDLDPRYVTLNGATTALDRFSRVLVGDGLDRFDARLKGTLVGIGARLRFVDDHLRVVGLFAGGPAERAGLREGDHVVRVDGVPTAAMPINEAVRRIRGEVGTPVVLDVERPSEAGAPERSTYTLSRAEVVVPNVTHEVLAGGVGYLRIDSISQKTLVNLRQAIGELRAAGASDRGLLLDLRGNSGGSMKESAAVVDQLVADGLLLTTAGRDGRPVPHLMERIDGRRTGDELTAPLVVLVDARTASGAEIIAGALVEHGRAALLGQRTYGKGRVQKIYELDSAARLKLTVAEYVLANDRRVGGEGLHADLVVGRVGVTDAGLRLGAGWDLEREGVAWSDVVPVLAADVDDEGPGSLAGVEDPVRELARRAVLAAGDRSRDAVLGALKAVAREIRVEEEGRIAAALQARGLDWRAAPGPGAAPEAVVRAELVRGADADEARLVVTVENHGPTALYRTFVRTSSAFSPWDAWMVPVGRVAAGATARGEVRVTLPAGLPVREDRVALALHADHRPPVEVGEVRLRAPSTEAARLGVTARLVGEAGRDVVRVTLRNLADHGLDDVEAELAWPYDLDIELVDRGARTPSLVPGGTTTFDLGVRLGPTVPTAFPLRLAVDAADHGRVVAWELPLHRDGRAVDLVAPVVDLVPARLSGPPGPMGVTVRAADEGRLTSVVLFHNGQKVLWSAGGQGALELRTSILLAEGANLLSVRAVDDEGLTTRGTWSVLGLDDEGLTRAEAEPDAG